MIDPFAAIFYFSYLAVLGGVELGHSVLAIRQNGLSRLNGLMLVSGLLIVGMPLLLGYWIYLQDHLLILAVVLMVSVGAIVVWLYSPNNFLEMLNEDQTALLIWGLAGTLIGGILVGLSLEHHVGWAVFIGLEIMGVSAALMGICVVRAMRS